MGRTLVTTQGTTMGTTPSGYWNLCGRRGRVRPCRLGQATVASGNACVRTWSKIVTMPSTSASVKIMSGPRLYDAGMPLERVARRLGSRSLDAAAEDIALDWRSDP